MTATKRLYANRRRLHPVLNALRLAVLGVVFLVLAIAMLCSIVGAIYATARGNFGF
jgi:hypothetical protein